MPNLGVTDLAAYVRQQRAVLPQRLVPGQDGHAGERPDLQPGPGFLDVLEAGDAVDVDDERRPGQAQPHERQQRMASGQQLGVLVLAQEVDGLLDRFGPLVVERCRDHRLPSLLAFPFASRIVRHTRSGDMGRSMSVTPRWESASMTAFTTAGGEAMVPVSPTPLTPNSFVVEGVSLRPMITSGTSGAAGTS